jgi:hypothetical protein
MATQAKMEALLRRMRGMSAADISVLDASAQTPDSNMTTAPGSPNEALWSEMVELGWITKKADALELPGRAPLLMTIYSISPEGLQPILHLLSALSQD